MEMTIKCKPWKDEPRRQPHKVDVDDDGCVRVYDPVAGYFTTCHSLSRLAQAGIRGVAKDRVR